MAAPFGNHNHLKHGMRSTRIYNIWRSMKDRCLNPNSSNYHNYGERGIEVCEEWTNDFIPFYKWSMENGYSDDLTIDRINNNGNYTPSNCRWVSYKEQNNNKRSNKYYEYNGEVHTLSEWGNILGIKPGTLWARLKNGWTLENALNKKVS